MKSPCLVGAKQITFLAIAVYSLLVCHYGQSELSGWQKSTESTNAPIVEFQDIDALDQAVETMIEKVGGTSASLAVTRDGELVYSRGYGHRDRRAKHSTTTRNIFRLASCSKPFTAAAVRKLIERGDFAESTLIFEYLEISPTKELQDPRVKQITIKQLLEHKGGWNRDETFDPLYRIAAIRRELRVSRIKKHHIVRYMWDRPIQFDPGSDEHYSNFGYLLLGLAIEKATGKSYVESVRELIAEPLNIENVMISSPVKRNRNHLEVHYPSENKLNLNLRDSAGGLAMNSESLCKFMTAYWLDGRPRAKRRTQYFYQFGSHPNTTTALMEQRLDGINYAVLINRRLEESYNQDNIDFRDDLNRVIGEVKDKLGK